MSSVVIILQTLSVRKTLFSFNNYFTAQWCLSAVDCSLRCATIFAALWNASVPCRWEPKLTLMDIVHLNPMNMHIEYITFVMKTLAVCKLYLHL